MGDNDGRSATCMLVAIVVATPINIVYFTLTALLIAAGIQPHHLQEYAILSLNTTSLKAAYLQNTTHILPIPDVYNLHMRNWCSGYYASPDSSTLVNISCSTPAIYFNFQPADIINEQLSLHNINASSVSMLHLDAIQHAFTSNYNYGMHIAVIFYALVLAFTGINLVPFLLCIPPIAYMLGLATSIFNIISTSLATVIPLQTASSLNSLDIGISATVGSKWLTLVWVAFGFPWAAAFTILALGLLGACIGGAFLVG